ncbi:MAG: hypothetical protein RI885_1891 [Actinomycetota bacterium]
MLAAFEHIIPTFPLTWKIHSIDASHFDSVWHFHREFELTFIRRGHGNRLIGDSVGDYGPGDLTLIGPDLPHTYVSTLGEERHAALVVQFRRDFLGEGFFETPMFESVAALLDSASRGLSFVQEEQQMNRLEALPPAEKTVALLALLLELSHRDRSPLAREAVVHARGGVPAARIEAMVEVMHSQFESRLTLADIAAAAHVTPSSASRLFARSTGSTISTYLNVVRVNAACRLLRDSESSIADIAAACGYANLSNFNRRFRQIKGITPRQYRPLFDL